MKCCSRSTLGVIIGILNILIYIGACIVVVALINSDEFKSKADATFHDKENEAEAIGTILLSTVLSACLLMIIISGLLIMGIVKRRHKLMWPWLALSGLGFVCSCGRVILMFIISIATGVHFSQVLQVLFIGLFGVGIQALILWPIYTLCRDISNKNNQKPGQIIGGVQYSYVTPPDAPPQYSYYSSPLPEKS